jgi:hypothetical protein
MHWPIIRTLLAKEVRRLAANRGALALAGLLVATALALSLFGAGGPDFGGLTGPRTFWIDYWQDSPWVEHLRATIPPELRDRVRFRPAADIPADRGGTLRYSPGDGAVQLRVLPADGRGPRFKVWFWHAGGDPGALAPFEEWFWRESHRFFRNQAIAALPTSGRAVAEDVPVPDFANDPARLWQELHRQYRDRLAAIGSAAVPDLEVERSTLRALNLPHAVATALVLFALFFVCVCLLPAVTCEERERGILLAQAISPASTADLLTAKALCYVPAGAGLAAILAGLSQPAVWAESSFWLALSVAAVGAFGLGVTVAGLARTQRAASTGALTYALAVALVIVICRRTGIPAVVSVFLEAHVPSLVLATFDGTVTADHWHDIGLTVLLAAGWMGVGIVVFGRRVLL